MNVLFLTTHLNTGGITQYLLTLTKGFVSRGVNVHVVSGGGNREDIFTSMGAKILNLDIRTKSELSPKIYKALKPLKQYIKENHIDVIHAQTRITQVMGVLLHKMTGCLYVSTCHGFFKPRLFRRIIPCWGQRVIAISEAVEKHLIEDFGVDCNRVCLVKSGIDLKDFEITPIESKAALRVKFNLNEDCVIGMIARLSDVKGQDVLVEAMSKIIQKIPDVKLLLIGEGKLEGVLRRMVTDLNLENHVQFHPIVNQTPEMLSILDVCVNPSRQEGLGLSVMEAQAAGLPVVASNVGGIPSLIEHGKTGVLVEPENPEALADAIIELLQNRAKSEHIGRSAGAKAKEQYSSDKMVEKTLAVYEKYSCCKC